MSETELTETLSEEALERLNDRYGFWRKGKCDRDVMCALNELGSHRQRLAVAEQRATESDARAQVLTELLIGANDDINHVRVRTQRDADRLYAAKDKVGRAVRALTAPATQPDERAAAIKAALDRLAKRILAEIVYCAPENRALAEEVARVARIETDLIVARHDATDGATKEGA